MSAAEKKSDAFMVAQLTSLSMQQSDPKMVQVFIEPNDSVSYRSDLVLIDPSNEKPVLRQPITAAMQMSWPKKGNSMDWIMQVAGSAKPYGWRLTFPSFQKAEDTEAMVKPFREGMLVALFQDSAQKQLADAIKAADDQEWVRGARVGNEMDVDDVDHVQNDDLDWGDDEQKLLQQLSISGGGAGAGGAASSSSSSSSASSSSSSSAAGSGGKQSYSHTAFAAFAVPADDDDDDAYGGGRRGGRGRSNDDDDDEEEKGSRWLGGAGAGAGRGSSSSSSSSSSASSSAGSLKTPAKPSSVAGAAAASSKSPPKTPAVSGAGVSSSSGGTAQKQQQQQQLTTSVRKGKETNNILVSGMSLNRTFVVRGSKLGAFKYNDEDQLEYLNRIPALKSASTGEIFTPAKAMLHRQDEQLLLLNPDQNDRVLALDLEYGKITEEWTLDGMPVSNLAPVSKYAQTTGEQTVMAVNKSSVFTIDPRINAANKVAQRVTYAKPEMLNCVATSGQGFAVVGSGKGEIRLFQDVKGGSIDGKKSIAKTLLPGLGDPILDAQVTCDGSWILLTCKSYLLLVNTVIPGDAGKDAGKSGFQTRMGAHKPMPIKLQISAEDVIKHDMGEISFTPAHFNTGTANAASAEEEWIATSTGPFIVTWNFRRVKKGVLNDYKIKLTHDQVVTDLFRHNYLDQVVVAQPDDVFLEKRVIRAHGGAGAGASSGSSSSSSSSSKR